METRMVSTLVWVCRCVTGRVRHSACNLVGGLRAAGEPEWVCCKAVRPSDSGVRHAAPDGQGTNVRNCFFVRQSEARMNQAFIAKMSIAAVAALMVAGCATKSAPDIGGRWKPVNRFAAATTEIPLYSSYVYQASPMDGTLKAMLERWAKDSGRTLDYRLSSDFTLYGAVSSIDTTNAQQAVIDLTAAYAAQGISVSIVGNQIVVQSAGATPTASAQGAESSSGT
ncbi:hypothetical protein N440_2088 [Stenotrophomonas sp. CC22-02]|nr:hypothetical protein N440_2088 [Stenotrophomonas sp. CC22-02]